LQVKKLSFADRMLNIKVRKNNTKIKAQLFVSNSVASLEKLFGDLVSKRENKLVENYHNGQIKVGLQIKKSSKNSAEIEQLRAHATEAVAKFNGYKQEEIYIKFDDTVTKYQKGVVLEAVLLASYQFNFLKSKPEEHQNSLQQIALDEGAMPNSYIEEIVNLSDAVNHTRDLVNWPQRNQTAEDLADSFINLSKEAGFSINVLTEAQIESMKMGGILAVNQGSSFAPTFSIMEWKPKKAKNKKTIVLVGKGIVYDTGGLSLKTMPGMASMKCDMHGAATVGGLMYVIAKNKLPLHVVGLVPSTDNWVGKDAYAPGDVITMFDKTTVEIMNTDAEGRLILADALHYAKKYKPEMVFDFATLTGAAVRAIGEYGSAIMGTAPKETFDQMRESGDDTYERVVEFPLWPEYRDELKSNIADMTNLGKSEAGAQSAGQFLKHFTDYPWVHVDIAGPSFLSKASAYRPAGGTGVGVRLLYNYLKSFYKI